MSMDKLGKKSRTSIQCDFQQSEEFQVYHEYITMVNEKMETMSKRQVIAEELIEQYKIENQQLKQQNQYLHKRLSNMSSQLQYLKQLLAKNNTANMEDRILDLARKNQNVERKIFNLAEQLQRSQSKVAKLTKIKHEKTERTLHSYLQLPKCETKTQPREAQLNKQIRSLKWKLKQKEEEIIYLIKRNKMQEEKQPRKGERSFKKAKDEDRFFTCQTEINKTHI